MCQKGNVSLPDFRILQFGGESDEIVVGLLDEFPCGLEDEAEWGIRVHLAWARSVHRLVRIPVHTRVGRLRDRHETLREVNAISKESSYPLKVENFKNRR